MHLFERASDILDSAILYIYIYIPRVCKFDSWLSPYTSIHSEQKSQVHFWRRYFIVLIEKEIFGTGTPFQSQFCD